MLQGISLDALLRQSMPGSMPAAHVNRSGSVHITGPGSVPAGSFAKTPARRQPVPQSVQSTPAAGAASRAPVITLGLRVMRAMKKRCIAAATVHSTMSKVRPCSALSSLRPPPDEHAAWIPSHPCSLLHSCSLALAPMPSPSQGKEIVRLSAFRTGLDEFGVDITAREAAALFALLDQDGDGSLSWKELETLWSGKKLTRLKVPGASDEERFETLSRSGGRAALSRYSPQPLPQQQSPQIQRQQQSPPSYAPAQIPLPEQPSVRVNRHGSIDIRGSAGGSAGGSAATAAQPFAQSYQSSYPALGRIVSADAPLTPNAERYGGYGAGGGAAEADAEDGSGDEVYNINTGTSTGGSGLSSEKRGTYFGTYSPQQAASLRGAGRTHSTFVGGADSAAAARAAASVLGAGQPPAPQWQSVLRASDMSEAAARGAGRMAALGVQPGRISLADSQAGLLARIQAQQRNAPHASPPGSHSAHSSPVGASPSARDFAAHFANRTAQRLAAQAPQFDVMEMGNVARQLASGALAPQASVRVNRHGSVSISGAPPPLAPPSSQMSAAEYAEQQKARRAAESDAAGQSQSPPGVDSAGLTRHGRRKLQGGTSARRGSFFGFSATTNKAAMASEETKKQAAAAEVDRFKGDFSTHGRPKGRAQDYLRRTVKKQKFNSGIRGWTNSPRKGGTDVLPTPRVSPAQKTKMLKQMLKKSKSKKQKKKAKSNKATKKAAAGSSSPKPKPKAARKPRGGGGGKPLSEEEQRMQLIAQAQAEYFAERAAAKEAKRDAASSATDGGADSDPAPRVTVNRHGSVDIRPAASGNNGGFGTFSKPGETIASAIPAGAPKPKRERGSMKANAIAASKAAAKAAAVQAGEADDSQTSSDNSEGSDSEDARPRLSGEYRKLGRGTSQRRGSFFGTFKAETEVNEDGAEVAKVFVPPFKDTGGWIPTRSPTAHYVRDPHASPTLALPRWNPSRKWVQKDPLSMRAVEFKTPTETIELIGKPHFSPTHLDVEHGKYADEYGEGGRHHGGGSYDPNIANLSSKERRKRFGGTSQRRGSFFGYKAGAKLLPDAKAQARTAAIAAPRPKSAIKALAAPKNMPKRIEDAAKVHVSRHGSISISRPGAMTTQVGRDGARGVAYEVAAAAVQSQARLARSTRASARAATTRAAAAAAASASSSSFAYSSTSTSTASASGGGGSDLERLARAPSPPLAPPAALLGGAALINVLMTDLSQPGAAGALDGTTHIALVELLRAELRSRNSGISGASTGTIIAELSTLRIDTMLGALTGSNEGMATTRGIETAKAPVKPAGNYAFGRRAEPTKSRLGQDASSRSRSRSRSRSPSPTQAQAHPPTPPPTVVPPVGAGFSGGGAPKVHVNRHGSIDIRGAGPELVRISASPTRTSTPAVIPLPAASAPSPVAGVYDAVYVSSLSLSLSLALSLSLFCSHLRSSAHCFCCFRYTDAVTKIALACGILSPEAAFGLVATMANDADTTLTPTALKSALHSACAAAIEVPLDRLIADAQYAPLVNGAATTTTLLFDAVRPLALFFSLHYLYTHARARSLPRALAVLFAHPLLLILLLLLFLLCTLLMPAYSAARTGPCSRPGGQHGAQGGPPPSARRRRASRDRGLPGQFDVSHGSAEACRRGGRCALRRARLHARRRADASDAYGRAPRCDRAARDSFPNDGCIPLPLRADQWRQRRRLEWTARAAAHLRLGARPRCVRRMVRRLYQRVLLPGVDTGAARARRRRRQRERLGEQRRRRGKGARQPPW